jgi:hypothetical protein
MKIIRIVPLLLFFSIGTSVHSEAQIIKTSLTVAVLDGLGNPVQGATIQLFANEEDYLKEQNVIAEGVTEGNKAQFKFKDIDAIAYYVIVRKDDMDNSGGGEKIAKLEEKKLNKVNIIIE